MDIFPRWVWTILLIITFSPSIAQQSNAPRDMPGQIPTLYEQLCSVNKEWRVQPANLPGLHQAASFSSDEALIQTHLRLVETTLRQRSTSHLAPDVAQRRLANLDRLRAYWQEGLFPKNTRHPQRQPYFIDDFGTACAVGHLVIETGNGDFANHIKQTDNYAYIWDMHYPELASWADANGFTKGELAWIQPSYNGCFTGPCTSPGTTQNVSCYGLSDGCANPPTPTWGTGPYLYVWNGGSIPNGCNLPAGNHTCVITDSGGTSVAYSYVITQPAPLGANFTVTPNSGSCSGAIFASASGGTAPYTYSWAGTSSTGSTASSLCTGFYALTLIDANGCYTNDSIFVPGSTSSLNVTFSVGATNCSGSCDGWAVVNVSGGAPPYAYLWSNGSTSQTTNTLCGGNNFVVVSDTLGNIDTVIVMVPEPPAVVATFTSVTPDNGTANGTIQGAASGGNGGPYQFTWSNGATTPLITNLIQGTYCLTVTDTNGCWDTICVLVPSSNTGIQLSVNTVNVSCNGVCDGSATVTVTGGNPPYQYSWPGTNLTGSSVTGLCAGLYEVIVTDSGGDIDSAFITISQPGPVVINQVIIPDTGACSGSVTVSALGGTAPYQYLWSNATIAPFNYGLCSGDTHCITVTDANGCTATDCYAITGIGGGNNLLLSDSSTHVSCNGSCDGFILINSSNGSGPFTFAWSDTTLSGPSAINLCAGTYTVTVTDNNGITGIHTVVITEPAPLTHTHIITPDSGNCSGTATLAITGGVAPYQYNWANGSTSSTIFGLCVNDTVCVTVTDANGCTLTDCVIGSPNGSGNNIQVSGSVTHVYCNGSCDGSIVLNVSGGVSPYSYNWSDTTLSGPVATGLCAGFYTVTVTDAIGTVSITTFGVNQPPPLSVSFSTQPDSGNCSGTVVAQASGGTAPYQYYWSNGTAGPSVSGLCVGDTLCVTVLDVDSCSQTFCTIITGNSGGSPLSVFISGQNVSCGGYCDGLVQVQVSGGVPPYQYNWTNGAQGPVNSGLCFGTYGVTVTDAQGAAQVGSWFVNQPPVLTHTVSTTNANCSGTGGSALVYLSGGTPGYQYTWSNGELGNSVFNVPAGPIVFTGWDSDSCVVTDTIIIGQDSNLVANIYGPDSICLGDTSGLYADPDFGVSHQWYNNGQLIQGATNPSYYPTQTGTYSVAINGGPGCYDSTSFYFIVNPAPSPGPISGTVTVQAGQTYPYSVVGTNGSQYSWNVIGGNLISTAGNLASIQWGSGPSGWIIVGEYTGTCYGEDSLYVSIGAVGVAELDASASLMAYPNPYSDQTTLAVEMPAAGNIRLEVIDLLGQQVALLADGRYESGTNKFPFSAQQHGLSAGVYLARLTVAGTHQVVRLIETE